MALSRVALLVAAALLAPAQGFVPIGAGSFGRPQRAAPAPRAAAASAHRVVPTAQMESGENLRPDLAAAMDEMAADATRRRVTGLGTTARTTKRIDSMVKDNKVMLFMKGNKLFPQCGFSNTAVQVLRACDVEFETFDVLSDPDVRQGVKDYSQWPTIPQLYAGGEFIGGSDIMIEMFQSGDLKEELKSKGAVFVDGGAE